MNKAIKIVNASRSDVDASHYFASLGSVFSHGMHITSHGVIFVYYSEIVSWSLCIEGMD